MRINPAIAAPGLPVQAGLYRFLSQAVFQLRWATIAVLLLLTLVEPKSGRVGLPNWTLVMLFGGYNLLVDSAPARLAGLRPLTRRAALDLPVAGLAYFLSSEPGAPPFVLLFMAGRRAGAGICPGCTPPPTPGGPALATPLAA